MRNCSPRSPRRRAENTTGQRITRACGAFTTRSTTWKNPGSRSPPSGVTANNSSLLHWALPCSCCWNCCCDGPFSESSPEAARGSGRPGQLGLPGDLTLIFCRVILCKFAPMRGKVYKSTGSWYIVKAEDGTTWNARIRGIFKLDEITSTNPLAVGDDVELETENT